MATRFRLTADATAPAVSPALQSYSHSQGTRRQLKTADASALATSAYNPDGGAHEVAGDSQHIQFVSAPMNSGITFTSGETIKTAIQGLESSANANLFVMLFASIVSEDGGTVRRTLRSKVADGTEMATALTARFHSTTQDGANYTTVAGDRLVVEYSVNGTPAGSGNNNHNASLRWGGNGAGGDLLENDTETGTTRNPWIEFVPTITFQPLTVATGTATETDAAQAVTRSKVKAAGLATETDLALAPLVENIAGAIEIPTGLSNTTESALALTRTKIRAVGLSNETDAAFAVGRTKVLGVTVGAETDAAFSVTATKQRAIGLATSTSSALALAASKARAAGIAQETDSSLALGRRKVYATALASEVDEAFARLALAPTLVAVGLGVEVDEAISRVVFIVNQRLIVHRAGAHR